MKNVKWSVPQLEAFSTCPLQYYRTRVACDVEPVATEAAQSSQDFIESFSRALLDGKVPKKVERFAPFIEMLRGLPGVASINTTLSVDEHLKPCTLDKAWVKSKVNYIKSTPTHALLFSWRMGAREPSDALKLSAALYFCLNQGCVSLQVQTVWFRARKIDREQFTRADLPKLLATFVPTYQRYRTAYETNEWKPQPCGLCRKYCNVKDCKYNGV